MEDSTDGMVKGDELELALEPSDDVAVVSEPHAASVMTSAAAPAASARGGDTREEFTVATLQPSTARPAGSSFASCATAFPDHECPTTPELFQRARQKSAGASVITRQ
jgi:hypothetical protein